MGYIRRHAKHLLMCSPMVVMGAVLLITGAGVVALLPIVGCVAMMGLMMAAMNTRR